MSIEASVSERGAEAGSQRAVGAVTATISRELHVVVPEGIDDATAPSGGNLYDRRICTGLAGDGWAVRELPVGGGWPHPDAVARAALAGTLAAVPDGAVVLVDGLVACGVPEVVVPAARRLALIVLVHLPLGDEIGADPGLVARERETLMAATGVVATSPWAADRLVAQHGLDGGRIVVAAPGVDPAPLAPGTDGATGLLCVGSITPTKGQDLLVEALAGVADRPWRCDLVGPLGRDRAHVAAVGEAIARHRLEGRVRLAGPLVGAGLAAAFAAADLLVVPSRAETYGMVVTEALARGIPVLTTDAGGLPETLGRDPDGGVPGLVVPAGNAATFGAALRGWLEYSDLRDGLRRSARMRRGMLHGWEVTSRWLAGSLERLSGTRA